MDPAYAPVRACFANAIEIFPAGDPREHQAVRGKGDLPQMPQMPQARTLTSSLLSLNEDLFEERAAIIEYDGGLPRHFAEFLAGRRSKL